MIIWCNQDIESHRTWLENFGTTAEDTVKDNKLDTYVSAKTYPTVEVTIPAKSFEETVAEWINPVTGEQQGEQTVSINIKGQVKGSSTNVENKGLISLFEDCLEKIKKLLRIL